MISVFPLSGYKFITNFTVTINPSSNNNIINWGDNTFSNTSTATHVFSAPGIFPIFSGNCLSTSALNVSVYNGAFYENKIEISYNSLSAYASCPNTFNLNISSVNPYATIYLYASGSNSNPYNTERNFWSHLNPEWSFQDVNGNFISQLEISGIPVFDIYNNVLGYSALSSVTYYDDMPGTPVLFFTMLAGECGNQTNSRSYAALNYTISADVPSKLLITADGLVPINETQWADNQIPYVISVQGQRGCNTIMHYASGYISQIKADQECYGVDLSNYTFVLSPINLNDVDCFNTGGYSLNNFSLPSSALYSNSVTPLPNPTCIQTPFDETIYNTIINNPRSVVLSATAVISVNGQVYNLSGISNSFNIYDINNFYKFYRKGEDQSPYDFIKKYSHFDLNNLPNFDTYLSAIAGSGDSLGKVFDRITNVNKDMADLDICTIENVYDTAAKFGEDINDYGLEYPEELRRLMNFFSIPLQKLIGTRCICNTNFNCENCCGKNVCTICGFDKKSNVGNQITFSNYVTAGQTILIKENGSDIFDFLHIDQTCLLRDLTASPVYKTGIDNYCYYQWNNFGQGNPVEGVIDYTNPFNTLNINLSSSNDWYADNGVIEEMLNQVLTKNILSN